MDFFFYLCSPAPGEIAAAGMKFTAFAEVFDPPVKNVLLLKSEYEGEASVMQNFLTLEDQEAFSWLSQPYGDFHAMDYSTNGVPLDLTDQEICQLLYLSHMWKPLETPFMERLGNRFAFLAHDGDWSCKLYLKDWNLVPAIGASCLRYMFAEAAKAKRFRTWKRFWKQTVLPPLGEAVSRELFDGWQEGICIDVNNMELDKRSLTIHVYQLDRFRDMDAAYMALERAREEKTPWKNLRFDGEKWSIE